MNVEVVFFGLLSALMISFIFAEFFYNISYPRVLGQIIAGMVLGYPLIKPLVFQGAFPDLVSALSQIGIVFLMLLVGLKINVKNMRRASWDATLIAFFGFTVPLVMGFFGMRVLGYSHLEAVITGICLAISAEAVAVEILMEYNKLSTRVGTIVVEAGMIDDVLGVFSLSIIAGFLSGGLGGLIFMPAEIALFLVASYVIGFKVYPQVARFIWREKSEEGVFTVSVIFGLTVVVLSEYLGLSSLVGAFIAGLIIHLSIKDKKEEEEIVDSFQKITFGLIIPFFFISIGLNFEYGFLNQRLVLLILYITLLAFAGKLGGTYLSGKILRLPSKEASIIGWSMNSRGMVGLVVAEIARANNLITPALFTAIVATTLLTTLISPAVLRRYLQ
ncbi:MAG: hypothetical protein GF334_11695 [Candidatus Altiarchaeales archaeon]|nr:hypothetical protein [Candidatus Altiarchaeales archaeon]